MNYTASNDVIFGQVAFLFSDAVCIRFVATPELRCIWVWLKKWAVCSSAGTWFIWVFFFLEVSPLLHFSPASTTTSRWPGGRLGNDGEARLARRPSRGHAFVHEHGPAAFIIRRKGLSSSFCTCRARGQGPEPGSCFEPPIKAPSWGECGGPLHLIFLSVCYLRSITTLFCYILPCKYKLLIFSNRSMELDKSMDVNLWDIVFAHTLQSLSSANIGVIWLKYDF